MANTKTFRTFIAFVLAFDNGNPANYLSTLLTGKVEEISALFSCRLWAAKMLCNLPCWSFNSSDFMRLYAWSFIEYHNNGSHPRTTLDSYIHSYLLDNLKGSCRWNANDRGGYWKVFRDSLVAFASRYPDTEKEEQFLVLCDQLNRWDIFKEALPLAEKRHARFQRADHLARTLGHHWEKSQEENQERIRAVRRFLLSRGEDTWSFRDPLTYLEEFILCTPVPDKDKGELLNYFAAEFDAAPSPVVPPSEPTTDNNVW